MFNYLLEIVKEVNGSGLLLHEIGHGLIGVPIAIWLWKKNKSYYPVLLFFLVIYFIDLDHVVDFWLYGGISVDLLSFLELDYFRLSGRGILPFHGWEFSALFAYLYSKDKRSDFLAITLAIITHLFWDSITNNSGFAFYSLVYRIFTNFRLP